jgi:hypothetical protein
LACFFKFSSSTLEPDLHNSIAFSKTCALQPHSSSSSDLASGRLSHVGHRCLVGGLHMPESLLLFGAHDGHTLLSLAMHGVGWGLQWLIYGWVVPVTARVRHAPASPAESVAVSSASSHFLVFFFYIVLCILLISSSTFCLCIAQILLKFLLARC